MTIDTAIGDQLERAQEKRRRARLAAYVLHNRISGSELIGSFVYNVRSAVDMADIFDSYLVIGELDQQTLLELELVDGTAQASFPRAIQPPPIVSGFGRMVVDRVKVEKWDPMSEHLPRLDIPSLLDVVS